MIRAIESAQGNNQHGVCTDPKLGKAQAAGDMAQGTRGQLVGREASGGQCRVPPEKKAPTLAELGVSKNLSSRATLPKEPLP